MSGFPSRPVFADARCVYVAFVLESFRSCQHNNSCKNDGLRLRRRGKLILGVRDARQVRLRNEKRRR